MSMLPGVRILLGLSIAILIGLVRVDAQQNARNLESLADSTGAVRLGLASAQGGATSPQPTPPSQERTSAAGKDVLQRKCFQCHQIGMWNSIRQDRTAWSGVLYRMVGRGALWTADEISAMADYLAEIRGPAK